MAEKFRQLLLLDLFCGEGGAAKGYADAGFRVIGADINASTNPEATQRFNAYLGPEHEAVEMDWEEAVDKFAGEADLIHASPPCQFYSTARGGRDLTVKDKSDSDAASRHPHLIEAVRKKLQETGKPYVIENVKGARGFLKDPVTLCGCMFALTVEYATPRDPRNPLSQPVEFRKGQKKPIERDCGCQVYGICNPLHLTPRIYSLHRERLFETGGWTLPQENHDKEFCDLPNMPVTGGNPSSFYYVNGSFPISVDAKRALMGCSWMSHRGVAESIPPAFTRWIGVQFQLHAIRRFMTKEARRHLATLLFRQLEDEV